MTLRGRLDWLNKVMVDVASGALGPSAFALAFTISGYINNETGEAWPSQTTLAKNTGFTARTVRNLTNALKDRGHIRVEPGRGRKTTNRYRLQFTKPHSPAAPLSNGKAEANFRNSPLNTGSELPLVNGEMRKPGVGKAEIQRRKSGSRLPTELREELIEEYVDGFASFWAIYPLKKSKRRAQQIYARLIRTAQATHEKIIAGARRYADERHGQEARYTKHPTTWLNGGCWEDEVNPPLATPNAALGHVREDGRHFDGVRWVKPMGPA